VLSRNMVRVTEVARDLLSLKNKLSFIYNLLLIFVDLLSKIHAVSSNR